MLPKTGAYAGGGGVRRLMIPPVRGVPTETFPRNSGHFRLFDLVVVGIV